MKKPLALVGAGVAVMVAVWFIIPHDQPVKDVPYYDPIEEGIKKDVEHGEHHTVLDFSLVDQNGDTITRDDVKGKICVVEFFFTTCKGICPIMNTQMKRMYEEFKGNDSVVFLSHTVNPENDSVPVMRAHAATFGADAKQWHFLTGDKVQLYNLARKSYLVSDTEGDGSKEDFVHSEKFTLIDGNGHIRGMCNGTIAGEVDLMMNDVRQLLLDMK